MMRSRGHSRGPFVIENTLKDSLFFIEALSFFLVMLSVIKGLF
jgi:hypothetical protein